MLSLNELLEFVDSRDARLEQQLNLFRRLDLALPVLTRLNAAKLRDAGGEARGKRVLSQFLRSLRVGDSRQHQTDIHIHRPLRLA